MLSDKSLHLLKLKLMYVWCNSDTFNFYMEKLGTVFSFLPLPSKREMNQFFLERKARLNKMRMVHRNNCDLLPEKEGRTDLGNYPDLQGVLVKARTHHPKIAVCKYCIGKTEDQ